LSFFFLFWSPFNFSLPSIRGWPLFAHTLPTFFFVPKVFLPTFPGARFHTCSFFSSEFPSPLVISVVPRKHRRPSEFSYRLFFAFLSFSSASVTGKSHQFFRVSPFHFAPVLDKLLAPFLGPVVIQFPPPRFQHFLPYV